MHDRHSDRTELRGERAPFFAAALAVLVALAPGCGGPDSSGGSGGGGARSERYAFVRGAGHLMRLDSSAGQAWFTTIDGQNAWTALGSAPDPAGRPNKNGRYLLYSVERAARGPGAPAAKAAVLIRFDTESGRSWLIEPRDGAEWTAVAELEPNREEPPSEARTSTAGTSPPAAAQPPSWTAKDASGNPTPELVLLPSERFGTTVEEQNENVYVVMEALEKEGLPVELKVWGARQLGLLLPEVAVPRLLEVLDNEHPEVVVAAIESLGKIGDPTTIPRILALESHSDPRVRAAVQQVVQKVR